MPIARYFEHDRHTESLRNWNSFKILERIGSGTYGEVFKAQDMETGGFVVLKKVKYSTTFVRELEIMAKMNHVNVLKLKETFAVFGEAPGGDGVIERHIVMVFEYMHHDLSRLRHVRNNKFSPAEIKCFMQQLLLGLHYLHSNGVLHRDIKGENLLVNNNGILKIADFGLAKSICRCRNGAPLTGEVITLYYRPPELLLGQTIYGPEVDIWSVGCVFAEMFLPDPRDRLFLGIGEIGQLNTIFDSLGYPNENIWPGVTSLEKWKNVKVYTPRRLIWKKLSHLMDKYAVDLLKKMIQLCPSRRITAKEALDSEYFWTDTLPCHPSSIARYPATCAAKYFEEKEKEKAQAQARQKIKEEEKEKEKAQAQARQKIREEEENAAKRPKISKPNPNLPLTQGPVARGPPTNTDQAGGAGGALTVVTGPGRGRGRGRGRGLTGRPPRPPGGGPGGGGRGPNIAR